MRVSVYLPLLLSAVLAVGTPVLSRRLAPTVAARVLTLSAAVTAAASTWGLLLLATTLLQHTPEAEEHGTQARPVPALAAAVAVVALTLAVSRAWHAVRVRLQTDQALRRICQSCHPDGELVVLRDAGVHAYAVPGRPGRILVSTGLLRTTDPGDRRVVLAHERAHLRQSHHLLRAATELAAALNPLLIPARRAVTYLVERAADEAAADAVGSRTNTAAALVKIALASAAAAPGTQLAFHQHAVLDRVAALRSPPVHSTPPLAAASLATALLAFAAAGDATLSFGHLLAAATGL